MTRAEMQAVLEALLFVCGEAIEVRELARALECGADEVLGALEALKNQYAAQERGVLLQFANDTVRMCTNRKYSEYVEKLLQPVKTRSLSQSVVETLAIIAYKQPITRGEIEAIRGVRCEYAVQQLQQLGLVEDRGRKKVVGRPVLLGTTDKFLQDFDIRSLDELPSVSELSMDEEITV